MYPFSVNKLELEGESPIKEWKPEFHENRGKHAWA